MSSGQQLAPTWEHVFAALSGTPARIAFVDQPGAVAAGDAPDRLRLPHALPYPLEGCAPADWYRAALLHRAAHYELGTFAFSLRALGGAVVVKGEQAEGGRAQAEAEADLEYLFAHLAERALAERVFTDLEDTRVETRMRRRYGGFAEHLELLQHAELGLREPLTDLPPRRLGMELLCRRSLGWPLAHVDVPVRLHPLARLIDAAAAELERADAVVAGTVLWTLRLYQELCRLPVTGTVAGPGRPIRPHRSSSPAPLVVEWEVHTRLEGQDEVASPIVPLPRYRDGLGFRHTAQTATGRMESPAIFRFVPAHDPAPAHAPAVEVAAPDGEKEGERPQRPEPGEHEHYELVDHHYRAPTGRLSPVSGRSYLYPEWDASLGQYRPAWCRIRELVAVGDGAPGDGGRGRKRYGEVLAEHRVVLSQLRTRAERLLREGRRAVRRVRYGDDIDLDAAVDALTDLAAGLPPSPDVHIAREPVERDLAMVVLFDLSSSTAERVPVGQPQHRTSEGLRTGAAAPLALTQSKRILDVELEAMALLLGAFSATGDQLGLYGFSSSGRGDVQFVIVKDLLERLSSRVTRRLDGIEPIHSTRMGPAVRHASRKLRATEASTRVLLLVCDGRPYDLDYAPDGREQPDLAYAIADTRRALEEAADEGLRVKVLGIDHTEQHFIAQMCGRHVAAELLPTVELLPQRIVALYADLLQ